MTKDEITKVWLTDDAIWLRTLDGREAYAQYNQYPRLKYATKNQRESFELNHFGIHWDEIDEDLSFDGFFEDKPKSMLYKIFMSHPELNASVIARRLGMSQNILAQYISGTKRPSKENEHRILDEVRKVGAELQAIPNP